MWEQGRIVTRQVESHLQSWAIKLRRTGDKLRWIAGVLSRRGHF